MIKNYFLSLLLLPVLLQAQPATGYYNAALGKSDAALKTQLYSIISSGTANVGYDGLYNIYPTSDKTADGKVWDMYSICSWTHGVKKCGNYSVVCDCYNREHSIPQSWFNSNSPMVSDAHHIYPTDGKVNGQRSNYPYGECSNGTTLTNGKGKLGSSSFAGYSGTVWEPDNEYKGDLARTYFYFTTRYMNTSVADGGDVFGNTFGTLNSWCVDLFLKWSRQDPVSQKEITRNNAIEAFQHNRNPYIDYPDLAEYIWGTKKGTPWSVSTGIDALHIEFSIFPNPVQDYLNIKSEDKDLTYTIYNLNGQIIMENNLDISNSIHTGELGNGMYLLQLSSGNKKSIQKFIVNK